MPIISRSFGGTVPAHAARRSRKDGVGEILSKFPTLDARRHRGAWYGFCAHPAPAASFAAMEHVNPLVTVFVLGIIVAEAAQAKTFLPWRRSTTRRGRSWMQCKGSKGCGARGASRVSGFRRGLAALLVPHGLLLSRGA